MNAEHLIMLLMAEYYFIQMGMASMPMWMERAMNRKYPAWKNVKRFADGSAVRAPAGDPATNGARNGDHGHEDGHPHHHLAEEAEIAVEAAASTLTGTGPSGSRRSRRPNCACSAPAARLPRSPACTSTCRSTTARRSTG